MSLTLLLVQVGAAAKAAIDRRVGFGANSWRLLLALDAREPIHLRELARRLGLSRQAVKVAGRVLVEEGLATVQRDPADDRLVRLVLTGAGVERRQDLEPAIARLDEWLLAAIPRPARHDLPEHLERMSRSLALAAPREWLTSEAGARPGRRRSRRRRSPRRDIVAPSA